MYFFEKSRFIYNKRINGENFVITADSFPLSAISFVSHSNQNAHKLMLKGMTVLFVTLV